VREVSANEVRAFARHLAKPAEAPATSSFDAPLGPEMTVEQYESLIQAMTANAAQHGVRKPHG
jgi:hypothetical protein